MYKGTHLLIDCCNVSRFVCYDANALIKAMSSRAERATATVILQVRYHFELYCPSSYTAMEFLTICNYSSHSYIYNDFLAPCISTIGGAIPCNSVHPLTPSNTITRDSFDRPVEAHRVQYGIRVCWEGVAGCFYSDGSDLEKFVFHHDGGVNADGSANVSFFIPHHI